MKKLKIKYDFQIFNSQKYGGISKYFYYLFINLKKIGHYPDVIAPFHINEYLNNLNKNNYFSFYFNSENKMIKRTLKLISFLFDFIHSKFNKYDIVHNTYFASKLNFFGYQFLFNSSNSQNSKKIITFYDMSYLLFPDLLHNADSLVKLQKEQCSSADLIISISKSTKNDLVRHFKIDEGKIRVVHLGIDKEIFFKKKNDNFEYYNNFILFVGTRGGYKNFDTLIKSFINLKSKNINLVVFGSSYFNIKELNMIKSLNISDRVFYLNGDDELLAKLYNSAKLFVYPSLYEGFGLPILEAMACGCPVLAGKHSSIIEVAGNAAKLIDTNDSKVLTDSIDDILNDEKLSSSMADLGLIRSNQFSWEKCAKDTMSVYNELLKK